MGRPTSVHRLPRARIDPIDGPDRALSMIFAMIDPAGRPETIAMLLDHQRRGLSILAVDATSDPDSLLGIVDAIAPPAAQQGECGGLVIATVRPGGGVDRDDLDRWIEASELCEQSGIELVEWFVVGTSVVCPRALCGHPARWVP